MRLRGSIFLSFVAAVALAATGCVGSLTAGPGGGGDDDGDDDSTGTPDAGPTGGGQAKQMFESEVKPIIGPACGACHAGTTISPLKFMGTGPDTAYYDAIIASPSVHGGFDPALAQILTKGEHENGLARALTPAEKQVVTGWLQLEDEERNAPTPGAPDAGVAQGDPLAQFSACMTIEDWNASQVYRWAAKATEGGDCASCHSQGAGGFFANDDITLMFEMTRYQIFLQTVVRVDGSTVVVNEPKLYGKASSAGHPQYALTAATDVMLFTKDFVDRTNARAAQGLCGPPGYPPPPAGP